MFGDMLYICWWYCYIIDNLYVCVCIHFICYLLDVYTLGDTVFDGSLGSRLDRMRRMLGAKQVNTIL